MWLHPGVSEVQGKALIRQGCDGRPAGVWDMMVLPCSCHAQDHMVDRVFLRKIPYFRDLSPSELRYVASVVHVKQCERGELIMEQGQTCPGLFFVLSGRVKAFRVSPHGREQVLRVIGPGESFNEVAAFEGSLKPSNVQAIEASEIGCIVQQDLEGLLVRYPAITRAILRYMCGRLRAVTEMVTDLSLLDVKGRVAKLLLTYPPTHSAGHDKPNRAIYLTQEEIAARLGSSREVVGRALRELEAAGAVQQQRRHIVVLDPGRLSRAIRNAFK